MKLIRIFVESKSNGFFSIRSKLHNFIMFVDLGDIDLDLVLGCQMVYFQNKNPKLGKLNVLQWKNVGKFYVHLVDFTAIS
jgi:hypothetical protein